MKANCALKLKMKTQVSKGSKNFVQKKRFNSLNIVKKISFFVRN